MTKSTVISHKLTYYIIYIISVVNYSCVPVLSSKVLRPRGVSLAKAALYDPAKSFSCFDGSGTIPFTQVNDDYCDCLDGSDEPGTSACLNGTFHCSNIGHVGIDIASSFVNDGVCDCCDATDEYSSNADCIDVCLQMGETARIEAKRKAQIHIDGYNLKRKMIEDGANIKKEKQAKVVELTAEKELVEIEQKEKLSIKESVEIPEREALEKYKALEEEINRKKEEERKAKDEAEAIIAFENLDADGDNLLTVQELQSTEAFDTNRDGAVSEEEALFYLDQKENINREHFLSIAWKLMKPAYQYRRRMFIPPSTERPGLDETNVAEEQELKKNVDKVEEGTAEEEENLDYEHSELEEETEESEDDYAEELDDTEVIKEKEEAVDEEKVIYDDETQRLIDIANAAREEFNSVDQHLRDVIKEIHSLQEGLDKDFGPNDEFSVLEGNCYEFTDREYTYKLCPFNQAVQNPKSGGGETKLGTWGHWAGTDGNPYTAMKYTGGQACWNGPQRSAEVVLSCDVETSLISVSEPNRCEYLFLFTTPAACSPVEGNYGHQHTEL